MQSKTTRAFRTISEAGEELDLQPHVLRFWESKFPQIKPIKRGGGRRFYRPEDIEFLRGIKILLHDEGHPIKDVQKLIRLKGSARVMELGQSVEKASRDRKVEDTVLVPPRIQKSPAPKPKDTPPKEQSDQTAPDTSVQRVNIEGDAPFEEILAPPPQETPQDVTPPIVKEPEEITTGPTAEILQQRHDLEEALIRLQALKARWAAYKLKKI